MLGLIDREIVTLHRKEVQVVIATVVDVDFGDCSRNLSLDLAKEQRRNEVEHHDGDQSRFMRLF
jgi:hypothetical protein